MYDISLISIWKANKCRDALVNFHSHNYHELVYYCYGNGKTTIGDVTYTFSDNSYAVIPPGVSHDEHHFSDSEIICLVFSGADLPFVFAKDTLGAVQKILREIYAETKNQSYGYKDMIEAKLNELCVHILRNGRPAVNEKNFEYILNFLKENYHEKIKLSDCAKQLSLSYDYFQHRFKEITGFSPQQYLMKTRLECARKMLRDNTMSCTDIAYSCGFSTSAQFSAIFKREYGMTPREYTEECKMM